MSVSTTLSPGESGKACAAMTRPSVVFLVNAISAGSAPSNCASSARPCATLVAAQASAPERGALALLVGAACATVVAAGPIASYTEATAQQLLDRKGYIAAVLGAETAPPAWNPRADMKKVK